MMTITATAAAKSTIIHSVSTDIGTNTAELDLQNVTDNDGETSWTLNTTGTTLALTSTTSSLESALYYRVI